MTMTTTSGAATVTMKTTTERERSIRTWPGDPGPFFSNRKCGDPLPAARTRGPLFADDPTSAKS